MEYDISGWVVEGGKETLFHTSIVELLKEPIFLLATKEQIQELETFSANECGYKIVDGKELIYFKTLGKTFYVKEKPE